MHLFNTTSCNRRSPNPKRLLLGLLPFLAISGFAQTLNIDWSVPTGNTTALVTASDPVHGKTYVGGDFTRLQSLAPYSATTSLSTGQVIAPKVKTNGEILTAISDGNGGFYIGGTFTQVNDQARSYIAHIDQNNELTAFNPTPNYFVTTLALNGGVLYMGGNFLTVNGTSRHCAAAVNATTGALSTWNPDANNVVYTILVNGSQVLVGGNFTTLGGTARSYLASVNATTGALNAWNPAPDQPVRLLEINNGYLYVRGGYNTISGQSRDQLARFNSTTLLLDSWDYGTVNGSIGGICFEGTKLYLFGAFNAIAGESRQNIAVYDLAVNALSSQQLDADDQVLAGANVNGKLYFGGEFTTINGVAADHTFCFDPSVNAVDATWDPKPDGDVKGFVKSGSSLLTYGSFSHFGQVPAAGLLTYETATGQLSSTQISLDGSVTAVSVQQQLLILNGTFTTVNGVPRNQFAIIDLNTNQLLAWNKSIPEQATNFKLHGDRIFFTFGNTLASIHLYNDDDYKQHVGVLDQYLMTQYPKIYDYALFGDTVVVAGLFHFMNGAARDGLGFYNLNSEEMLSWNPGTSYVSGGITYPGWVNTLAIKDHLLYFSGQFHTIFGAARSSVGSFDLLTGSLTAFNPSGFVQMHDMEIHGNKLTAGGSDLLTYDLVTNTVDPWLTDPDNVVAEVDVLDGTTIAVGYFNEIGGIVNDGFAVFDNCRTSSVSTVSTTCSYAWNGVTYDASGVYAKTFTNAQGCDSTAYLNLTIEHSISAQTVVLCVPTYTSGAGNTYDSTGLYIEQLTNMYGCDSLAYLDLEFYPVYNTNADVVEYSGTYTWPANGQTYTLPGTYDHVLTSVHGCDSIIHLNLTFLPGPEFTPADQPWVADGVVHDIEHDSINDRMILAGDFTGFSHRSYGMDKLDPVTGIPTNPFPAHDGDITNVLPDGSGGYFITGSFTTIGDSARSLIAHLDASMHVTAWQTNTTYYPEDLLVTTNYLFTRSSNSCVAIDRVTGLQLSWVVSVSSGGHFNDFAFVDGYLYLAGNFTIIYAPSATTRKGMAQIDPATGAITAWNGNFSPFNPTIYDLEVDGSSLYIAGDFTVIAGSSRNRVARLTVSGATLTVSTWNPNANNTVHDVEVYGSKVMLVGAFTTVAGSARAGVACASKTANTVNSFNPGASLANWELAECHHLDGRVYFQFAQANVTVGSQTRSYLASFDTLTYAITSWDPKPGYIAMLSVANDQLFSRGNYGTIGYQARPRVAAFDPSTLELIMDWMPAVTGPTCKAVTVAEDKLFVIANWNLQVFDLATGTSVPLANPILGGDNLLDYHNGYVYVSGFYHPGDPTADIGLKRIEVSTLDFDPSFNAFAYVSTSPASIFDVTFGDSILYVAGNFDTILGQGRQNLAGINLNTMQLTPLSVTFDPNYGGYLYQVEVDNDLLYLMGPFDELNGEARYSLASVEKATGNLTSWTPEALHGQAMITTLSTMVLKDQYVYVCGWFQNLLPTSNGVVMLSKTSNATMEFTLQNYAMAEDMEMVGNRLHIVGEFAPGDGYQYNYLAFDFCDGDSSIIDTIYEETYTWYGTPYNQSGTYYHVVEDPTGCDSILTLHLTLLPYVYDTITAEACTSYTWAANGQTYYAAGIYTDTLFFTGAPDSVRVLALNIASQLQTQLSEITCTSFYWQLTGTTYTVSGTYADTLTSVEGCDSIVTLQLMVLPPSYSTVSEAACGSFMWPQTGMTYTASGTYTDTLVNMAGCDSILVLNLVIGMPSAVTAYDTACGSYTWNGTVYTVSGEYLDTIAGLGGCDSIVALELTILQPTSAAISLATSGNYTWPLNGETYTVSGIYTDTIPNAAGCDSIVTLTLTVYPLSTVNTFSLPSDAVDCNGGVAITVTGNPNFTFDIGNGAPVTTSGYAFFDSLCPGIYSAVILDGNGDTLTATFVVPVDSNYIFNNPFIDSLALDSLGSTVTNCDIYYDGIDSAYIASVFANADTITVTWAIVDSSGVNTIVTTYVVGNGPGVYDLQLSIFCPQKSTEDFFTVTQEIYFDGANAHVAEIGDPELADIGIFPNPTNDFATIVFNGPDAELTICDAQGKLVATNKTVQSGHTVSLKDLQSGVYFFTLNTAFGTTMKRVVKQ